MHSAISIHVFTLVELWNPECPERAFHFRRMSGNYFIELHVTLKAAYWMSMSVAPVL